MNRWPSVARRALTAWAVSRPRDLMARWGGQAQTGDGPREKTRGDGSQGQGDMTRGSEQGGDVSKAAENPARVKASSARHSSEHLNSMAVGSCSHPRAALESPRLHRLKLRVEASVAEKDLTGVGVGVSLFYPRRLPPPQPGRHPSGDLGIRVLGPSFHTHLVYSNAVPCTYLALLTSQMKRWTRIILFVLESFIVNVSSFENYTTCRCYCNCALYTEPCAPSFSCLLCLLTEK